MEPRSATCSTPSRIRQVFVPDADSLSAAPLIVIAAASRGLVISAVARFVARDVVLLCSLLSTVTVATCADRSPVHGATGERLSRNA
jgi:hypothetical protein